MTEEHLIKAGFVKNPHKVLGTVYSLYVGRYRFIKISSLQTPNEIVFISQTDYNLKEEHLVCVHNYDYDGYLDESKLNNIISIFK